MKTEIEARLDYIRTSIREQKTLMDIYIELNEFERIEAKKDIVERLIDEEAFLLDILNKL